ncbi:MAG: class I SAM-dependent methyltransferase [Pseudomonadota bacterium]
MTESRSIDAAPDRPGLLTRIGSWLRSIRQSGKEPPAQPQFGSGEQARRDFRAGLPRMIDQVETAIENGDEAAAEAAIDWFKGHAKTLDNIRWNDCGDAAKAAYFAFSSSNSHACHNYNAHLIEKSAEFDYIGWPREIGEYIRGRRVLDVGCGFGAFGTGFLIAGAHSYVGVDPKMKLDSQRAKNKRKRERADLGMTPRQIMTACPNIEYLASSYEELEHGRRFDVISMHNVTEHLLGIREVLPDMKGLLDDEGLLIFHHHNFYCWNGHHLPPRTPERYDETSAEQAQFADWNHILVAANQPPNHYFNTSLNQIRLDEIKTLTADNFEILAWDERESPPSTLARLDDAILAKVRAFDPSLTRRDLVINAVFCVARRR